MYRPLYLATQQLVLKSVHQIANSFNPKEGGLFGQLNMRGGMESTHFEKRGLTPPISF
jgi:hypothetical protein